MSLGKGGVDPEYRAVTASQKTQGRAFEVAVTAAIFSGALKRGWNVRSRREEFPDGKRSQRMQAEARSGERLATRSPMRFWELGKAQLHFGRRYVQIFYVQEDGGTVQCAT